LKQCPTFFPSLKVSFSFIDKPIREEYAPVHWYTTRVQSIERPCGGYLIGADWGHNQSWFFGGACELRATNEELETNTPSLITPLWSAFEKHVNAAQ
jgi:hypothetical protein